MTLARVSVTWNAGGESWVEELRDVCGRLVGLEHDRMAVGSRVEVVANKDLRVVRKPSWLRVTHSSLPVYRIRSEAAVAPGLLPYLRSRRHWNAATPLPDTGR